MERFRSHIYLCQIAIAEGVAQYQRTQSTMISSVKCRPRNSAARVQTIELHANRSSAAICNTAPKNIDAMKLATPFMPNKPVVVRRQDAILDESWRDIAGIQQAAEFEEKNRG
jgi:hypothetical protein